MTQASASTDEGSLRQRLSLLWVAAIALSMVMPAVQAQAQDDQRMLSQFHHTAWTRKEGAPAPIPALTQTSDGWLWLGTPIGLYRFDGVSFERFVDVNRSVASLLALPVGGLWIGYVGGGAALLRDGKLVQYDTTHGLPARSVQSMALDANGVVWAAAVDGLYRFDGARWSAVRSNTDASPLPTLNVVAGLDGSVWARSGEHVVRVAPGQNFAEVVGKASTETRLADAPDGGVWASPVGANAAIGRLAPTPIAADARGRTGGEIYFDREGRLWSAVDGGVRMTAALSASMSASEVDAAIHDSSTFTRAQGFTGRAPLSLVQDREGAVWIGSERGLDRFRRSKVQPVALEDSATAVVVAGADGSVWVGRWNTPPVRVDRPGLRELPTGPGHPRGPRICASRDTRGAVWLCGNEHLWHIDGDKVQPVPYPESFPLSLYVQALAVDRDGIVWMASAQGLHRRSQGVWQWVPLPGLTALGVPNAMTADADGRLLLGYAGGRVAVLKGDQLQELSSAQGLEVGDVKVITAVPGRYWVGGSRGVALCEGLRCRPLVLAKRAELHGVSGIVESRSGELWLNGAEGITRISSAHLKAVLLDPAHEPHFERFDSDDGLDGTPSQIRPMATATESADGRLWFTTSTNVYQIDPAHLPRNALPPPMLIRELKVGEMSFGAQNGLRLPQWAKSVSIRYTALSLAIPDRVRFRYRLSGVDDDWRDAGGRREVFYTNLAAGAYRFDVIASNDDGVWNDTGASLSFDIEPAFQQTTLFKVIAATLALTLAYGLYAWRVHVVDERARHRLEARMAERERIARDLHDTLLQGMHAVLLLLQAALEKIPRENALREQIERLVDRTERVLIEGRDRVHELRESGKAQLLGTLEEFGLGIVREQKTPVFHARMSGSLQDLHPVVHDEVLNIAREAISNAIAHAHAQHVELHLEYGHQEFRLTVVDDGCGIDTEILSAGFRPGHWGLVGMRERALKIDARLELHSAPQAGTTVELRVPARVAYLKPKSITERLCGWRVTS